MSVPRSLAASAATLRPAQRARWWVGGALNLFALALIVTEIAPVSLAS